MNGSKNSPISWWHLVLGIDICLILVTVLSKYPFSFPGKGWLNRHFSLATELNSGVWWSMACLLALALMAYELFSRQEGKQKAAWLVLSIVLAGLSLDEIGSLHERTHGWNTTRGVFLTLLAALVVYSVIVLSRSEATRRASLFIASAFFVFGWVALQEYLERYGSWPEWTLGIRAGLEEGSELLGVFLLFCGIIPQRTWITPGGPWALLPNPFLMKNLRLLLLGGVLVHSLGSFIFPTLMDLTRQGNPLTWYPSAVFFLLFSATYWKHLHSSTRKPLIEVCLSVFFLLCSVGFAYRLPKLFGRLKALVPDDYLPGVFLFSVVAGLLVLSTWISDYSSLKGKYFPVLLAMPPLCLLSSAPEGRYFAFGLLAYLVFHIFGTQGSPPRTAPDEVGQYQAHT